MSTNETLIKKGLHHVSIEIPDNINVKMDGKTIIMQGPKGVISRDFSKCPVQIEFVNKRTITVKAISYKKFSRASVGTVAAHLRNMIKGVTKGFKYVLKIVYSHFPITVEVKEDLKEVWIKSFKGEKGVRKAKIVGDDVTVSVSGDEVVVTGINIENVGQTAANICQAARIKGLDPRVFQDGIYLQSKGEAS
jgi:large subunit ribosomal protein L6